MTKQQVKSLHISEKSHKIRGDLMELKPKDEHILTALLSCGSIAEAEKISGVSRTTIYNRLADETFKAEYDRRRSLVLNEACTTLQATLTKAVDTIRGIMEDTDTAPQV